ncbi:glycosyl hydrolase [Schinkia azotoformans]|uniref:glycoside hydrolase family 26 protein n=1 Tax=Schinkia azotoformans TaxID=1454 RepID=UPI002DB95BD7|nr:glycosyl hydrolase [Schinkia azotoformans]MEC1721216.1 glycosyl hydrolase [Schinkia azotoformans]MED4354435.1 glycosyl hydrolase [Schinkia azotoformans]MED4414363.1 glycosyl hydrolase [Schinkia azotoformans]
MHKTKLWFYSILSILLLVLMNGQPIDASAANSTYSKYVNSARGYQLNYPSNMEVDDSIGQIRTLFHDDQTQIEIYYDNFYNTVHDANTYINYSNNFIANKKDHLVEYNKTTKVAEKKVHILKWHRNKLAKVENDKNYYFSAEIIKNKNEVFTIFIKSAQPISNEMDIVKSFKIQKPIGNVAAMPSPLFKQSTPESKQLSEETKAVLQQYFSKDSSLTWGIFEPSAPGTMTKLNQIEERVNHEFSFLIRYSDLDEQVPVQEFMNAYNEGKLLELTLQTSHSKIDDSSIFYDILNGKYDEYLHQYAKNIKEFGHPVLFRLNNEMNGDWCVYSSYYFSKDTDLYKEVWKYIYHIFDKEEIDNVLWVWNPNHDSMPGFAWNHSVLYYPGDEYVDIVGLTAYNTGTYYPGEKWTNFFTLYQSLYNEYSALSAKPLMITEFGSNSVGGDKSQWIQNMFSNIDKFPRIKVAIWWSGTDWDSKGNPARIYRLDENEAVLDIFRLNFEKYNNRSVGF